jgi:hypothetical protein
VEVLQGLRSQLGPVETIGGAAIGAVTGNRLGYGGYECALALFSSSLPKPAIIVDDLSQGELEAGRRLGARLGEVAGDDNNLWC